MNVPATWSLESQKDYCVSVIAGLKARPRLVELATPWSALKVRIGEARDARDAERETLLGCSARVNVLDVEWDAELVGVSGQAYLDSGKDAGQPPYVVLFGSMPAAEATHLGVHKATAFGTLMLAKTRELQLSPALGEGTACFALVNDEYRSAGQAREEATEKVRLHDIRRSKLLAEVEQLVATTEVGILTAFPGRRDLVRAILSVPSRTGRSQGKGKGKGKSKKAEESQEE